MKKLYAILAAFAVMFIADYLWFGVIFKGMMEEAMPSSGNESVVMHAVGELCFAALLAMIYPIGYKGGSAVSEGMKFGLLLGLVYALPGNIHWYASGTAPAAVVCMFIANGIVVGILGGITVASVYGKSSAT